MRTKHIVTQSILGLLFGSLAVYLLYWSHWFWGGAIGLFAALMFQVACSSNLWNAACPYCSAVFEPIQGLQPDKEGKVVQCKSCFEYSVYSGGRVRPQDPNSISEVPSFVSPVFERGVWPKCCVACGAPPTRLEGVKTRDVSYGMLALGRLWVTSGKASGIPYCDKHKDAVSVKIDARRRVMLNGARCG